MKHKLGQSLISSYCAQQQSDEQTNESQLAQSRKTILKLHRGLKELQDPEPEIPIHYQSSSKYRVEQCFPDYWQLENNKLLYKNKHYTQQSSQSINKQLAKQIISQPLQSFQQSITIMHQHYSTIINNLSVKLSHLQQQVSQLHIQYATRYRMAQHELFEKEHSYIQQISLLKQQVYQLKQNQKSWIKQKKNYNLSGPKHTLDSQVLPVTIMKKEQQKQLRTVKKKEGKGIFSERVHSEGDLAFKPKNIYSRVPNIQSEDIMMVDEQILSELSNSYSKEDSNHNVQIVSQCLNNDDKKQNDIVQNNNGYIKAAYEQSQVQQFNYLTTISNSQPWVNLSRKYQSFAIQRKPIPSIINVQQLQQGYSLSGQEKYLLDEIEQLRKLVQGNHQQQFICEKTIQKKQKDLQYEKIIKQHQITTNANRSPIFNTDIKSTAKKLPHHNNAKIKYSPKDQPNQRYFQLNTISSLNIQLQSSIKREHYLESVLLHLKQQLSSMKRELNYQLIPCQYCGLRNSLMEIL